MKTLSTLCGSQHLSSAVKSTALTDALRQFEGRKSIELGGQLLDLLEDSNFVTRRVETIQIETTAVLDRKVSLSINSARAQKHLSKFRIDTFPLAILPKGLIYQFDLTADGRSIALLGRDLDSHAGAFILSALAARLDPKLAPVTPEIFDCLKDVCHSFPDGSPVRDYDSLSPKVASWMRKALAHKEWSEWMTRLSSNFILLPQLELDTGYTVLKIRRLESISTKQDELRAITDRPKILNTYLQLAIPVYDFGTVKSDHIRVKPPVETFLSDAFPTLPLDETHKSRLVRVKSASFCWALYMHGGRGSPAEIIAILWPKESVVPRRGLLLSWYTVALLIVLIVSVWLFDAETAIRANLEVIVPAALAVPTIVAATLFAGEDRQAVAMHAMLRPYQILASIQLVPLSFAVGVLVTPLDHIQSPLCLYSSSAIFAIALAVGFSRMAWSRARASQLADELLLGSEWSYRFDHQPDGGWTMTIEGWDGQ